MCLDCEYTSCFTFIILPARFTVVVVVVGGVELCGLGSVKLKFLRNYISSYDT